MTKYDLQGFVGFDSDSSLDSLVIIKYQVVWLNHHLKCSDIDNILVLGFIKMKLLKDFQHKSCVWKELFYYYNN